ncbi:unnamed protein product [Amoebophrya sp. A120]|nr:unnamed protein product [Amoebophrya sp. A120]|eukprot:GSA120T00015281001.1
MSSSTAFPSQQEMARVTFEIENAMVEQEWEFNEAESDRLYDDAPWKRDPHFFKKVHISAIALLKMVLHARSGGSLEIMGLMQGKATASGKFIVLDAFPLPVEGTETRVNAGAAANEFMCTFKELGEQVGKKETIMGWYHSHPGYRPWLSGIDVSTQRLYQAHQEPFLAVVIDPFRTCTAGKVDIGAFRTLPPISNDGRGPAAGHGKSRTVGGGPPVVRTNLPVDKVQDFGVHADEYYAIPITYFKSRRDAGVLRSLWARYWQDTLTTSAILNNHEQTTAAIENVSHKISMCPHCRQEANWQDPGTAGDGGNDGSSIELLFGLRLLDYGCSVLKIAPEGSACFATSFVPSAMEFHATFDRNRRPRRWDRCGTGCDC